MEELLSGHPDRIKDNLDVEKVVFRRLVSELSLHGGLQAQHHIDGIEQLGIFLYLTVTNLSIKKVAEQF